MSGDVNSSGVAETGAVPKLPTRWRNAFIYILGTMGVVFFLPAESTFLSFLLREKGSLLSVKTAQELI